MKIRYYLLSLLSLLVLNTSSLAQSFFEDGLSPAFHKGRREALRAMMPDNSAVVIFTNPVKMRSNDTDFHYRPNSDFYYLTGLREPNAALLLFKNPQTVNGQVIGEILYVQPKDPAKEQWNGVRLGIDGAKQKLGFDQVFVHGDFLKNPAVDFGSVSQILTFNIGDIETNSYNMPLKSMAARLKEINKTPARPADIALNGMMDQLRVIKTEEEIALLRKAIEISGLAHMESFRSIQPGVSERAIQGVHEFVHKVMDAEYIGYGTIVGSGNNSTILHYVDNSVTNIQKGVMLMDVGAEYRGYSGDITRTVPVKGVFSPEEKAIYEIVLQALEVGIATCKPGAEYRSVGAAAQKVIDEGLAKLGLIKAGERHPYFPHGIGHHLGLDVHDRGGYGTLKPGMVLTVEPGIYIPEGSPVDPKWWGIGVRIEDNILITEKGHENLSAFVPKTVEDLEKIMMEEGILQKLKVTK